MTTHPRLVLLFAVAFAFFILVPPFLGSPFPANPLMHWADVLDVLTPLVLIPLYWLLFTDAGRVPRSLGLAVTFLVLGALWTLGHGMHLSANSVSNLLGPGQTAVHDLIHFYDEVLSHYLWHAAIIGLSVLLLLIQPAPRPEDRRTSWGIVILSAILYGFTYFAAINEGGTVPLGLPAAGVILLILLVRGRAYLRSNNLVAFFLLSYVVALALFAIWFGIWKGFPEFSETGIL